MWGFLNKVGILDFKRRKIGSKLVDIVFTDCALNSAAYRLLVLESNHITETKDAEFFENIFLMNKYFMSSSIQELNKLQEQEE